MGHIIFLLGMLSLVLHIECTEIAVVQSLSHVQLSVILGTAVHKAALSMALPRQEYQEWVATPSSTWCSRPRDWTWLSCIDRQIPYHWAIRVLTRLSVNLSSCSFFSMCLICSLYPFSAFLWTEYLLIASYLHYQLLKIPLCFLLIALGFIGEGNGTPLQYSCLEKPMDWGAW